MSDAADLVSLSIAVSASSLVRVLGGSVPEIVAPVVLVALLLLLFDEAAQDGGPA